MQVFIVFGLSDDEASVECLPILDCCAPKPSSLEIKDRTKDLLEGNLEYSGAIAQCRPLQQLLIDRSACDSACVVACLRTVSTTAKQAAERIPEVLCSCYFGTLAVLHMLSSSPAASRYQRTSTGLMFQVRKSRIAVQLWGMLDEAPHAL